MEIYTILILAFVIFAWSRVLLRFRDRQITAYELGMWSAIWAAVITILFVPELIGFVAHTVGIQRPIDVAVYAAIIILFYLLFKLYVKLEATRRDITRLVQKLALHSPGTKKGKKR